MITPTMDYPHPEIFESGKFALHEKSRNNSFEIIPFGEPLVKRPTLNEKSQRSDRFEIIWVRKGGGILRTDHHSHMIEANTVYCIPPGYIRSLQLNDESIGHYVSFIPEYVNLTENYNVIFSWLEKADISAKLPVFQIDKGLTSDIEAIVTQIQKEYLEYCQGRPEIIKGLLNIFLLYLSLKTKKTTDYLPNRESELTRRFMVMLKKYYAERKMVCEYASELNVTPGYLNSVVKKVSGNTASHHIQQKIILETKRLAIYENTSMKEIAYKMGFDNLAHFSKFFKNNCGLSFTDFKKDLSSHLRLQAFG